MLLFFVNKLKNPAKKPLTNDSMPSFLPLTFLNKQSMDYNMKLYTNGNSPNLNESFDIIALIICIWNAFKFFFNYSIIFINFNALLALYPNINPFKENYTIYFIHPFWCLHTSALWLMILLSFSLINSLGKIVCKNYKISFLSIH